MKRFVPLVVILGLLGLSGCSGDSPSAPPVPTVVPEAWTIVSISVSDPNPLLGNVVLVLVEVTRNGSPAPDGTTVRLTASGGGLFSCSTGEVVSGVTEAMVSTQDGVACAQFVANEPGAYVINATVNAVTRQVQVVYRNSDPTNALQIFQPLLPNRGPYDGGQPVTVRGKGIVAPVDVIFSVDDTTGTKQVVQYPAIIQSVVESSPPSATGIIEIITPFISHVRDEERIERLADVTVIVGVGTGGEQQEVLIDAYTYEDEQDPPLPEDSAQWRVTGTPLIYIVQPDSGPSAGGNTVTIIGNHFAAILLTPEGQILDRRSIVDRVLFNNLEAVIQQVSADGQQIQVTLPRFSTTPLTEDMPVPVTIEFTSDIDSENGFPDGVPDVDVNFDGEPDATIPSVTRENAYVVLADEPQPDVVSLSPSSGPIDGGTQVTIYGSGFQIPLEVRFGNLTARDVQLFDDTSLADDDLITCVTPDYSQQNDQVPVTVDVRVTNLRTGKSDALSGGFTYGDNLYITGNSPFRGGLGTPVVIFGAGFEDPLEVFFGGDIKMDVISVSGTELLVRFPTDLEPVCSDRTGTFTVSLLEAQRTAEGGSFVLLGNRPSVVSVDPTFVQSLADGDDVDPDEVTIFGVNFSTNLIVEIQGFRMASADVEVIDDRTINVRNLPAPNDLGLTFDQQPCFTDEGLQGIRNAPTPVDVTVINLPGECRNTLVGGLVYEPEDSDVCVVAPDLAVAPLVFEDTQFPGPSTGVPVSILNSGAGTADITIITLSGRFFFTGGCTGQAAGPLTIPPFGFDSSLTVYFCPNVDNGLTYNGQLVIQSNDPQSPTVVNLSAQEAQIPQVQTAPFGNGDTWTFPATTATTCSATQNLNIQNTGDGALTLAVNVTAPFSVATPAATSVPPGGATVLGLQFCPTIDDNALQAGTLTLTTNDPGAPTVTITLEGTESP